jgi:sugar/nucleoside kinase (ribokinase family)
MSYLGLKTAVTGKIGLDSFGIDIASQLKSVNLDLDLKMGYGCTDSKIFFKTPDNTVTRNYHLGMSKNMTFNEIDSVKVKNARNLFITGNLLDNSGRIRIAKFVTRIAKESDTNIIFDINNVRNIVNDRNTILEIMKTADVNIISLDEAYMLFETNNPEHILTKLSEFAPINVLKQKDKYFVGEHGRQYCVTKMDGGSRFADEFFAAGFVFGYNQKYGIDKATIIGSYMASKKEI